MAGQKGESLDELYDRSAEIAEKHLDAAMQEGGDYDYLVAVMMVEAAVNAAAESTSRSDIIRLLQDLVRQIEQDIDGDQE